MTENLQTKKVAAEKALEVKNLSVSFKTDNGLVRAVRGVSFDLYKGETLCIVGESGSGKSVTSKAIMGILANNAIVDDGTIMYEGENLLEISEEEYVTIRGNKIGMIFQDPLSSLNPIVRIGKQITEATLLHANKLKTMFDKLIDKEFVKYKNLCTQLRVRKEKSLREYEKVSEEAKDKIAKVLKELEKATVAYKAECKSEIKAIKDEIDNDDEIVLKALFDVLEKESQEIEDKYEKLFEENPDEQKTYQKACKAELKEKQVNYKIAVRETKKDSKAEFYERTKDIKPKYAALINEKTKEANEQIAKIKAQLKEDLPPAKQKYKDAVAKFNEAYKPQIAQAKEELKISKAQAKIKVDEYAQKVKGDYQENINSIKAKYTDLTNPEVKKQYKAELKTAKIDYMNNVRITKAEAKRRALEIMREVGIPMPEKRFKQYPFEFSGGMRQRIVIAIALTATPDILICDEPTTALDVTIQAQILELINKLKRERNLSCIFITHDLGVVANMADRVAVMYAGKIVEYGTANDIFYDPRHPYTWALLSSIPDIDSKEKLDAIPGTPPNMIYPPKGDAFALRSKYAMEIDFKAQPPFFKVSDSHYAATWLLHPDAPKVEMPKIVSQRIKKALEGGK